MDTKLKGKDLIDYIVSEIKRVAKEKVSIPTS